MTRASYAARGHLPFGPRSAVVAGRHARYAPALMSGVAVAFMPKPIPSRARRAFQGCQTALAEREPIQFARLIDRDTGRTRASLWAHDLPWVSICTPQNIHHGGSPTFLNIDRRERVTYSSTSDSSKSAALAKCEGSYHQAQTDRTSVDACRHPREIALAKRRSSAHRLAGKITAAEVVPAAGSNATKRGWQHWPTARLKACRTYSVSGPFGIRDPGWRL